jgi:hypothetical protein
MIVDKACFERGCACYDDRVDGPGVEVVKKEWVGLTDEEIADEFYKFEAAGAWYQFAHAIEAKLKEKNQ